MANTYTQLHIQFVFAVKYRKAVISPKWKDNLLGYMTGIFQSEGHKMLQINSMPDHLHAFIGLRPDQSVSSLCQLVKSRSTKWVNNNGLCKAPFGWQDGFGAFSYSKSHVDKVVRYLQNQEVHHRKESFLDEYKKLLKAFQVEYDDRYIFQELI